MTQQITLSKIKTNSKKANSNKIIITLSSTKVCACVCGDQSPRKIIRNGEISSGFSQPTVNKMETRSHTMRTTTNNSWVFYLDCLLMACCIGWTLKLALQKHSPEETSVTCQSSNHVVLTVLAVLAVAVLAVVGAVVVSCCCWSELRKW
jgi:hypothetical protein